MKKTAIILVTIFTLITSYSCDSYLDVVPDDVPTIEYAFRNKVSAEQFLVTCYSLLPDYGSVRFDPAIAAGDEFFIHNQDEVYRELFGDFYGYNIKLGQQNISEPLLNFWEGTPNARRRNGKPLFVAIRDCNIFLENIDLVRDIDHEEKVRWIAEVKFLKAYYHFYLLRMYGPIPLVKENIPIAASTEESHVSRQPFDECVTYIADLIDEAAADLPLEITNIATEAGRINKVVALATKAELLVLAASPLFNGNATFAAVNPLFNSTHNNNKWKLAMDACKAAIDILPATTTLYEFNDPRYVVSDETKTVMSCRNVFSVKWNSEIIWGMPKNTVYDLQHLTIPYFSTSDQKITATTPILAPAMNIVEMFYSNNGVPIDEDKIYDYDNRYAVSKAVDQKYYIKEDFETANINQHREPRFYANLGFDGGIWFGNGRFRDVGTGSAFETSWVVNAKAGQMSGKTSSLRYSGTGYFIKKYSNFESVTTSTGISYTRYTFPIIRLASLYLWYAEARNEYSGPDSEVYHYIDLVRKRAGLEGVVKSWANHSIYPEKPLNKTGLREIIRQERMIEMAFEGSRFWDIRRWMIANEVLNTPIRGWNVQESTTLDYYNLLTLGQIKFTSKEYLWPLSEGALRQNPNLIQNPLW